MKSLDARMGSIDGQLAFPGFDSNRCNLGGASMNVYHKGRGREHFRKGHLHVEQFVESALSEEPEVGGCESSTREYQGRFLSEDALVPRLAFAPNASQRRCALA